MRIRGFIFPWAVFAAFFVFVTASAQSLGDFARQERERRAKEGKTPTKVYTNDNLPERPPWEGPTAASGISETLPEAPASQQPTPPGEQPAMTSIAAPPGAPPEPEAPEDKMKTRDYWQARFKAARGQLAAAEEVQRLVEDELSLLQIQRARELSADIQNELDARIRGKSAELDAKRADTAKARNELAELEKEFKESGAPADWSKAE